MTDEAFKRRFYEDRTELAGLGIQIAAEADDAGGRRRAVLPPRQRLLPAARRAERRGAHGAGRVPRRARGPLRLLAAPAPGAPQPGPGAPGAHHRGRGPAADRRARDGRPGDRAAQAAGRDRRAQDRLFRVLRHRPRPAARAHRRPLRPAAGRRRVVPDRLVSPAPRAAHLPPLAYPLAGHPRHARAPRLRRAEGLRPRRLPRPPVLAARRSRAGTARIRVAPEMAWWVEAHWAHCGTIERQERRRHRLQHAVRGPAAAARLAARAGRCGGARGAGRAARASWRAQLRRLDGLLDADATAGAAAAGPPAARTAPAGGAGAGRADRLARGGRPLHATRDAHHLSAAQLRASDEALLDVATIRADLGVIRRRTARRRAPAQPRQLRRRRHPPLRRVRGPRRDCASTCDLAGPAFARPARLSPLQADTLLLAIELVGGQLPTAPGAALASAAAKLRGARERRAPDARERRSAPARRRRARRRQRGHRRAPPARHRLLDRRHRAHQPAHRRAVPARAQPRRVVLRLLVPHRRRHGACSAWPPRRRRDCSTSASTPRPDMELDLYRREGIPASGSYAPKHRHHLVQPGGAPLDRRAPAGASRWRTARASPSSPTWTSSWLSHHLLRFADQARPVAPPEAVADLRATVRRLLAVYAR